MIFDRVSGVKKDVIGEGTHFFVPWLQRPVIFDVRTRPRKVETVTGTKGNGAIFSLLISIQFGRIFELFFFSFFFFFPFFLFFFFARYADGENHPPYSSQT